MPRKEHPATAADKSRSRGLTFRLHSMDAVYGQFVFTLAAGKLAAALKGGRRTPPAERENRFLLAGRALRLRGAVRELAGFEARLAGEDQGEFPAPLEEILRYSGNPAGMPQAWRTLRVAKGLARAAHAELDEATPPSRQAVQKAVELSCRAVEVAMNLGESYPRGVREATLTMAKIDCAAIQRRCGYFEMALEILDDAMAHLLYNADPASFDEHDCGGEECECSPDDELVGEAMCCAEGALVLLEQARVFQELGHTNEALDDVASALEIMELLEDAPGVAECIALRDSIFSRRMMDASGPAGGAAPC